MAWLFLICVLWRSQHPFKWSGQLPQLYLLGDRASKSNHQPLHSLNTVVWADVGIVGFICPLFHNRLAQWSALSWNAWKWSCASAPNNRSIPYDSKWWQQGGPLFSIIAFQNASSDETVPSRVLLKVRISQAVIIGFVQHSASRVSKAVEKYQRT